MSDTLRDQLLGLGFKAAAPERKPGHPRHDARRPEGGKPGARARSEPAHAAGKPRQAPAPRAGKPRGEIDLAKAYAIRAQKEKDERIEAERRRQEEARQRKLAKAALATLLQAPGRVLNHPDADIARHFEYGGKIKRIYVTAEQLKALNAGELGVLQQNGRYVLVTAATLAEAEAVFSAAVALKIDPNAQGAEDPYADPQFQVPDDLVW